MPIHLSCIALLTLRHWLRVDPPAPVMRSRLFRRLCGFGRETKLSIEVFIKVPVGKGESPRWSLHYVGAGPVFLRMLLSSCLFPCGPEAMPWIASRSCLSCRLPTWDLEVPPCSPDRRPAKENDSFRFTFGSCEASLPFVLSSDLLWSEAALRDRLSRGSTSEVLLLSEDLSESFDFPNPLICSLILLSGTASSLEKS